MAVNFKRIFSALGQIFSVGSLPGGKDILSFNTSAIVKTEKREKKKTFFHPAKKSFSAVFVQDCQEPQVQLQFTHSLFHLCFNSIFKIKKMVLTMYAF